MTETILQLATWGICLIPLVAVYVVREELKQSGTVVNVHGKDVTVVTVCGHQVTIK